MLLPIGNVSSFPETFSHPLNQMLDSSSSWSRRQFLAQSALVSAGALAGASNLALAAARADFSPPIVVFSKVYQLLSLNFEDAAALTSEARLNGVDVPVRPKGEVEPDRVTQDLPSYAGALKNRNLSMPLITTAITSVSSPHAEDILQSAKQCGVKYYRVGFLDRESDLSGQIREVRANLKDLAALNKQVGITALLQNHSPAGHIYLGGDLTELRQLVADFSPDEVGVAFDIGHALIVHQDRWREHFDQIKSHLKVAYVKDASLKGRWTPFGQGDVAKSGYFQLLKELHYHAPISMHLEYDWHQNGKTKDRATLLKALLESSSQLKSWLATA